MPFDLSASAVVAGERLLEADLAHRVALGLVVFEHRRPGRGRARQLALPPNFDAGGGGSVFALLGLRGLGLRGFPLPARLRVGLLGIGLGRRGLAGVGLAGVRGAGGQRQRAGEGEDADVRDLGHGRRSVDGEGFPTTTRPRPVNLRSQSREEASRLTARGESVTVCDRRRTRGIGQSAARQLRGPRPRSRTSRGWCACP